MNTYTMEDKNYVNSEEFQEFLKNNPSEGYLRIRAYAANGAVPIEGLKIIVSTKINQNNFIFFEGSTNESGVIEKIVLPAPKINANNLEAPNKLTYEIKASYLNNDIQKVYRVNIYENIYVVQNIFML